MKLCIHIYRVNI